MVIIPDFPSTAGLVTRHHLKGTTYASSTNVNESRVNNPIITSSTDRWCSKPTRQNTSETWGVIFDHMIYITNYTITNQNWSAYPISWKVEGFSLQRGWETISTITNSDIGSNEYGTFPTERPGPFQHFRFISIENGFDHIYKNYHFCLYKVDFFGVAFKMNAPTRIHFGITVKSCFLFILFI